MRIGRLGAGMALATLVGASGAPAALGVAHPAQMIHTLAPNHRPPDWARAGKGGKGGKGHGGGGSSTAGYGWSSSNWSG